MVEPTIDFTLLEDSRLGADGGSDKASNVVARGTKIKSVMVRGRYRRLLAKASTRREWESIVTWHKARGESDFSGCISEFVYAQNLSTGQLVAYEPHKQEVVAQLDYLLPEKGYGNLPDILTSSDLKDLTCLQIGRSSMLLLRQHRTQEPFRYQEKFSSSKYQRVGICNSVHDSIFVSAPLQTIVLV